MRCIYKQLKRSHFSLASTLLLINGSIQFLVLEARTKRRVSVREECSFQANLYFAAQGFHPVYARETFTISSPQKRTSDSRFKAEDMHSAVNVKSRLRLRKNQNYLPPKIVRLQKYLFISNY